MPRTVLANLASSLPALKMIPSTMLLRRSPVFNSSPNLSREPEEEELVHEWDEELEEEMEDLGDF